MAARTADLLVEIGTEEMPPKALRQLRDAFAEGVRAVIVEKSHDPKWDPATPEGVSDELIDQIFAPLPADQEWKPL